MTRLEELYAWTALWYGYDHPRTSKVRGINRHAGGRDELDITGFTFDESYLHFYGVGIRG